MAGDNAQGTGVAVDDMGNVALTGWFTGNAPLVGMWPPKTSGQQQNSFVILFNDQAMQWARLFANNGGPPGNQMTTGVVLNMGQVAVSGNYMSSLAVSAPPRPPVAAVPIATVSDGEDAFVVIFNVNGAYGGEFRGSPATRRRQPR